MQLFKNYASTKEKTKKTTETEASFTLDAELEESEMLDQMCLGYTANYIGPLSCLNTTQLL